MNKDEIKNWECGKSIDLDGNTAITNDLCNVVDIPEDTCLCNPYSTVTLQAMQNFLFRMSDVWSAINTAGTDLNTKLYNAVDTYFPSHKPDQSGFALAGTVVGMLGTLAGVVPALGSLGAGVGVLGGIFSAIGGQQDDPIVEITANISETLGNNVQAMRKATAVFTHSALWDTPSHDKGSDGFFLYGTDPTKLPSILYNGDFAETRTLGDTSMIRKSLASVAINALWAMEGIVVIKASNANGLLGIDPCPDDGSVAIFDNNNKHCDVSHGTMYVLRKWNPAGALANKGRTSDSDVPGQSNAWDDFNINTETVALSSEAIQAAAGKYRPAPPTSADALSTFTGLDLTNAQDYKKVFYNLPVCDLNLVSLQKDGPLKKCGDDATCRFNVLMYCGCAGHITANADSSDPFGVQPSSWDHSMWNGNPFPYDVDSKLCGIN